MSTIIQSRAVQPCVTQGATRGVPEESQLAEAAAQLLRALCTFKSQVGRFGRESKGSHRFLKHTLLGDAELSVLAVGNRGLVERLLVLPSSSPRPRLASAFCIVLHDIELR